MSDRQGAYSKKAKRRNDRLGVCHKVTKMCNEEWQTWSFPKICRHGLYMMMWNERMTDLEFALKCIMYKNVLR
jgi:hypothetical protein